MWRYVIAFNVLVLLWGIVVVFGLPLWVAVLATLLVAGTLGIMFLLERLAAKKGAKEIEQGLGKQADDFAGNVRPDRRAEIAEMREQFAKELQALKRSKLGGGGLSALYTLPWYMIIGPPGSGKSTALRNSGLSFPSRKGAVRGIGGTRNCDWWLSNEAVILDTAGRYTIEEEDRDEWLSFLDTVRRHRSKKPINGVIVAVSVPDLGGRSEEDVDDLAQRLRERVDELLERLQMVVPIYLIFTKCDLVPGFIECFGELRKEDRGQIWGATFPLEGGAESPSERFVGAFDELVRVLRQWTYARLDQERRIDVRALRYQFPQQLAALRPSCLQLVEALFSADVYRDSAVLRGVYFTSGTQEGRPVDLLAASVADAFGVSAGLQASESPVAAKSYFLRDVFARVVFPDKDIASRSSRGQKELMLKRAAIAGAAMLCALLLTVLPLGAYRKNVGIVRSTEAIVRDVAREREHNKGRVIAPSGLEALRHRLSDLKQWEADAPPLAMRYGMYQGHTIFPYLRKFYIQTLQRELVEPLVLHDATEMRALRRVYDYNARLSDEEYTRYFDKLKMHLLLTVPHASDEPLVQDDVQAWLVRKIGARWATAIGVEADAPTRAAMSANIKFYLELLHADPAMAIARDGGAVADTRALLGRVSYAEAVVKQVIAEAAVEDRELNIRRLMGGDVTPIVSDRSVRVRPAFTRWGWEKVVRERLAAEATASDRWVFGGQQDTGFDAEVFLAELRSAYFKQYIEEWRVFLGSLRISQPADLGDALRMLRELTRGSPPPLKRLMQAVDYNTHLEEKPSSALAGAAEKAGGGIIAAVQKKLGRRVDVGASAAKAKAALAKGSDRPEALLDADDVAHAFKDFVRFGVAPPPASTPAPSGGGGPQIIPASQTVPLDAFQEQLQYLRDALQVHVDNPQEVAPLVKQLQTTRAAVKSLLGQLDSDSGWRPRIEALTWPVIEQVSESLVGLKANTGRKWCSEVMAIFGRTLAQRYPFAQRDSDASVRDVADFLKPSNGVLWGFYNRELAGDILRVGGSFQFDDRLGGIVRRSYHEGLASYLRRAQAATNALFSGGELHVALDVLINPSPAYGLIALEVGGQAIEYRGGPEQWSHLSWPVGDPSLGAALRVRGRGSVEDTREYRGDWGLFRLIQAGKVLGEGHGSSFRIGWTLSRFREPVIIEFRPAAAQAALFTVRGRAGRNAAMLKLDDLDPPATITVGSPPCTFD
jgi:type VI secretion system protein ImpL